MPTPDGVRLATDLHFPAASADRRAAILIRTPYGKTRLWEASRYASILRTFVSNGFVVAIQDCRGRWQSEGQFVPCTTEGADGAATLDWITAQSWSNGRVGTYGCSYSGENQIFLARRRHPAHRAAIAEAAGGAVGSIGGLSCRFGLFENHVLSVGGLFGWTMMFGSRVMPRLPVEALSAEAFLSLERRFYRDSGPEGLDIGKAWRHLPVVDMMREHVGDGFTECFEDFASLGPCDDGWRRYEFIDDGDRFDVPTLHVNSWYDYGVAATIALFDLMRRNAEGEAARDGQRLILFPSCHCAWSRAAGSSRSAVGVREMDSAGIDYAGRCLDWFRRWLNDEPSNSGGEPPVWYYLMGRNQWRSEGSWPPATTPLRLYLSSTGGANSRLGDGRLTDAPPLSAGRDRFVYDPYNPAPSVGGDMCCLSPDTAADEASGGPQDQREVELRNDVLVYTSEALEAPLTIIGAAEIELHVSSSATDTDFTVKLVEVRPDGVALNLVDTVFRCRRRNGADRDDPLSPGEVARLVFRLRPTAIEIPTGGRLRVEVSSSNFPRFARNLNTGGDNHREAFGRAATNAVHHGPEHLSSITLPTAARSVDVEAAPSKEKVHA